MFAVDGEVGELNASYGNRINGSFILAPATPTGDRGIAASGNPLFVANGSPGPGTVSQYTADGVLVNPNFIVRGRTIAALFLGMRLANPTYHFAAELAEVGG
jgi:hypothetical protein